jgi:Ca2+-binding RTX toxin-like protein
LLAGITKWTSINDGRTRVALAAALVTGAMALCAAVALADNISCAGDGPRCEGTNNADNITGTDNRDEIFAKGGPDTVQGRGGPDTYHGGGGGDTLYETDFSGTTAPARDTMFGEGGNDLYIAGGLKGDEIYGGSGDDGNGSGSGLFGDEGGDLVAGGDGTDTMYGEQGDDDLRGGRGNDNIDANVNESTNGNDKVDCGPGNNDTATVDPNDDFRRCENVTVVP